MTNKAGEQPTITEALADELEAVFKRHSLASSYAIQSRVYEVANICLENRKEILNALRTTSLAAQDGLVEALDDATIDEIILNFAGGIVHIPSKHNPRGYVSYYRPRDAMRNALSAIKGDK